MHTLSEKKCSSRSIRSFRDQTSIIVSDLCQQLHPHLMIFVPKISTWIMIPSTAHRWAFPTTSKFPVMPRTWPSQLRTRTDGEQVEVAEVEIWRRSPQPRGGLLSNIFGGWFRYHPVSSNTRYVGIYVHIHIESCRYTHQGYPGNPGILTQFY